MKFQITNKETGNKFEVQADDFLAAAAQAAQIINKSKKVGAWRQTGTPGMGGIFQATTAGNPQSFVGPKFHVTEI